MKPGDMVTLLVDRDGYMVRTPGPYDEKTAREHVDALEPAVAERLSVVTLTVVDVRRTESREERALRDTDPVTMSDAEFQSLLGGTD